MRGDRPAVLPLVTGLAMTATGILDLLARWHAVTVVLIELTFWTDLLVRTHATPE